MKAARWPWFAMTLLAACASSPDRFYSLRTLPESAPDSQTVPLIHVRLNVTVPVRVARAEMVLNTSATGIVILDHERWVPALSDQVQETLARDIERRRGDLLVGDARFNRADSPATSIKVDIVRMSAERGGRAALEAHWRIVDAGAALDQLGNVSLEAAIDGAGYPSIAQAYSQLLSELAERLAAGVPRR